MNRVLKIAIVSPCFGTLGGIETYVCALARDLVAVPRLEVTLCFKRTKGFKLDPLLEKIARDSGANVVFPERASRGLVDVIRKADVIHCQNPCIDVSLIAKAFGKPVILTMHNQRFRGWHPRDRMRLLSWMMAQRRWYNSEFVWDTWDPQRTKPNSARLHFLCHLPTGMVPPAERRGFLFVSRWVPNKGLDFLVDAYGRANLDRSKWPLILLGDGPLRPMIEQKIREQKIEGIEIRGKVTEDARNDAMRHARWMVTPPNTKEDLGVTPIEARHVGVPCIITRDGGLPEAGGRHALSCEPANVGELQALLEKASKMEFAEYERLCEATHRELMEYLPRLPLYIEHCKQLAGWKDEASQAR